jgi:hypothetical protein
LPGPLKEWHWKRLDEVYPFNAPVESEAPKPAETLTIEVRF